MNRGGATIADNAEIATQLAKGSVEAFRSLFRLYSPEVFALCQRILGNRQDAEDVASEVFFEMWAKRERYDASKSTLRGYLLLLARSRSIDRIRSRKRTSDRVASIGRDEEQLEDSSEGTPIEVASRSEMQQLAVNALSELAPDQQKTLELSFFEGMSHAQISSTLDLPLGTVKSHIRRGLGCLRKAITVRGKTAGESG